VDPVVEQLVVMVVEALAAGITHTVEVERNQPEELSAVEVAFRTLQEHWALAEMVRVKALAVVAVAVVTTVVVVPL
jgi:hypothetical protein